MTPNFVLVESYVNPGDAAVARNFLDANGIAAVIENGALVTNLWHLGNAFGGVKLLVGAADVDRARDLLAAAADELAVAAESEVAGAEWTCASCGESVEANFDLCWKCGAIRGNASQPSPRSVKLASPETEWEDSEEDLIDEDALDQERAEYEVAWTCASCGRRVAIDEPRCWNCGTTAEGEANPVFPREIAPAPAPLVQVGASEVEIAAIDAIATRALRAAVFSLYVPPLILYSTWLLLNIWFSDSLLSRNARLHFMWAALFNLFAFTLAAVVLYGILHRF